MLKVLWNLFKREIMTLEVIKRTSISWLGPLDNMIFFSKLIYQRDHPNNKVMWNASIYIYHEGQNIKIWNGDLDMIKQMPNLKTLYKKIKHNLYIFDESYQSNIVLANASHIINYLSC